ncbi:unnamed protein product, partial [marine sediment metagenome]
MSRLDRETLTGVDITPAGGLLVLTKALPATLDEWSLRGAVRVSALAATKTRTLTLMAFVDGEHLFSTDWIFTSNATDAGRAKALSFRVPEAIQGTVTLKLLSSEATDTTVDVDARLNADVADVPNTWFVNAVGGHNTEHDGRSALTPFKTIQAAREVVSDGDTIRVAPGTYVTGLNLYDFIGVRVCGEGWATVIEASGQR